jgi:PAS domain S-box-containing protein
LGQKEEPADSAVAGLEGIGELWLRALRTRKPFFTNRVSEHSFGRAGGGRLDPDRFLAVPVVLGGEVVGQIAVASATRPYTNRDLRQVRVLANFFVLAIQRKRFEEELRRERDFAASVVNTAGALVVVLDRQGRILQFNQAAQTASGYTFEEVRNKSFFDIFLLAEEAEGVREVWRRLVAGQFPNQHENFWVSKGGDLRRIQWSNTGLVDGAGGVRYVVATGVDVTEQRKAEEESRLADEQRRLALEAGNFGTWDYDLETGAVFWDAKCAQVFGVAPSEKRDLESVLRLIHDEDREMVRRAVARAIAPGSPGDYEAEYRVVWADGSQHWVLAKGRAFFEQDRARRFTGTVQDVTDRRQAELLLRQSQEQFRHALERKVEERTAKLRQSNRKLLKEIKTRQLRESELKAAEQRYRTVADFTYDWEYWRLPNGALVYCSPSCREVSGYTPAELAARPQLLEEMVHPDDAPAWKRHLCEVAAELGPKLLTFRILRKDGGTVWIEHICRPVVGEKGEDLGLRASNRAVTDRRNAEIMMQNLRQELARVSRVTMAGQLAASLAHQLNQPLGAIVCNAQSAEQLLSGPQPDLAETIEALRDIKADSKRAGEVIQQMRALFQKTSQRRDPVRLNALIEDTLALLHSELVLKSASVELALCPELPSAAGNHVELQQVLINILLNALDAMAECAAEARKVRVSSRAVGGEVLVAIADSGPGFSPDRLERLAEPFFTTKLGGMGMGLAICRSILEAHGGRLWATNNPDRGATIHFAIPASAESSPGQAGVP